MPFVQRVKHCIRVACLSLACVVVQAQQNVVFKDNFDDNSQAWMLGNQNGLMLSVSNGKYYIQRNSSGTGMLSWRRDINLNQANPFYLECTQQVMDNLSGGNAPNPYGISPSSSEITSYGLFWGGKKTLQYSYFAFVITPDSRYSVINCSDGQIGQVLPFNFSPLIKQGVANKLAVSYLGNNQYRFLINGSVADSAELDKFYGNWTGFMVSGKQRVSFDNFLVKQDGTDAVVVRNSQANDDQSVPDYKNNSVLLNADVDFPPATFTINPDAIAVVIGNKHYQKTKSVDYALNDARSIKGFLTTTLGYKDGNIFYMENGSLGDFTTLFGTADNPNGKLYNTVKPGISDVFIYYSGHGAPGLKDNKGYFVPVECDPNYVENGGYSLDLFYKNLALVPAKSVTIVTDACFSGDNIYTKISPIVIRTSAPTTAVGHSVTMTSSSSTQVSTWYPDKNHGTFTYFFLKGVLDRDHSDTDHNGRLTYSELFNYVSDQTSGVPYYARKMYGIEQNPTIQGDNTKSDFVIYKK